MNSEKSENFTEILNQYIKLAEKIWNQEIKQKCLFIAYYLMASAYL